MRRALMLALMSTAIFSYAQEPTKEKCKEVYQGWVFNRILEETCEVGGVAARQIGVMAKTMCDDVLTESDRETFGLEVVRSFKKDVDEMGKERLCEIEVPRYNEMVKKLFQWKENDE